MSSRQTMHNMAMSNICNVCRNRAQYGCVRTWMKSTRGLLLPGNVYIGGTASFSHGLYFPCKKNMMSYITHTRGSFASNHPPFQATSATEKRNAMLATLNHRKSHFSHYTSLIPTKVKTHKICTS